MTLSSARSRTDQAGEHLQLLRSLAEELERAMQAMALNNLEELEESVANQQDLSNQLSRLADELNAPASSDRPVSRKLIDSDLMTEIRAAARDLEKLNLRYSILLKLSSRSAALMASLFGSLRGNFRRLLAPG